MTRDEVLELIRAHLADELQIDPARITEATSFRDDLSADEEDARRGGGHGVFDSRASRSRVEWSLGSPTMAMRPPYARTVSRSGTVSTV